MKIECDVAIVGGGPGGTTVGTLIKKYNPALKVAIFEQAKFPRDHVGESLLPVVPRILDEMGAWDKVEAAGFPVKLGATYKWGKEKDQTLHYFNFLPGGQFTETQRPGVYKGQRMETAFQVDRAVFDKILLDHAAEQGCEIYERHRVVSAPRDGDKVTNLVVRNLDKSDAGDIEVNAKYYVDASGGESLFRKVFEVGIQSPTLLRNIAVWDYWQNAEWAETVGNGATFVYVMSLGYGWIWFIPLSETRTSIGFITSAEYYKKSGLPTQEIYLRAIEEEPLISSLVKNATREERLEATKDWSFVADRLYGENWFMAGDACGFADPILAAGLSLTMSGSRRVAFTILELERGVDDPEWYKSEYQRLQRRNTLNHIRFADYWYSANEHFTQLKGYCTEIAADSGLSLEPDAAFQWLGTGGFSEEATGLPFVGTYTIKAVKQFAATFADKKVTWEILKNNIFELDLEGATATKMTHYEKGRTLKLDCYKKGERVWPLTLVYKCVFNALRRDKEIELLMEWFIYEAQKEGLVLSTLTAETCLECLEALVAEGWVKASYDPNIKLLQLALAEA